MGEQAIDRPADAIVGSDADHRHVVNALRFQRIEEVVVRDRSSKAVLRSGTRRQRQLGRLLTDGFRGMSLEKRTCAFDPHAVKETASPADALSPFAVCALLA